MKRAPKPVALNIFLLKDRKTIAPKASAWTEEEIIHKPISAPKNKRPLKLGRVELGDDGSLGILLFKQSPAHTPDWLAFLKEGLAPNSRKLDSLSNQSVSALLLAKAAGRQFILAFGHGRHLIDQSCVEHRFGLMTVLNSVSPDQIASIDKQTFDATPKLSRTQTVRTASIAEYEIDVEQDMLRAVVGVTKEEYADDLGDVLAGIDSLKTTVSVDLAGLRKLLKVAFTRSQAKDYLKRRNGQENPFSWVDNFQPVSDQDEIRELDTKLWEAISQGNLTNIWMSVPEITEWQDIKGFAYTSNQITADDLPQILEVSDFRKTFRSDASLDTLKKRNIHVVSSTGLPPRTMSAYKCLYFEHKGKNSSHILHAGSWYSIESKFENRVNAYFSKIPRIAFSSPFVPYKHKDEGAYNRAVAKSPNSGYVMLDRKLVQFGGGHSKIEVCDLMRKKSNSTKGSLVHVKRGKSSSSLSHLFAQGLVSSTLLASEKLFIDKVNAQLLANGSSALKGPVAGKDYEVVYAIVDGAPGAQLEIPFFSKVNLESTCKRLRLLGYDVKLLHIPVTPTRKSVRKSTKKVGSKTATTKRATKKKGAG